MKELTNLLPFVIIDFFFKKLAISYSNLIAK